MNFQNINPLNIHMNNISGNLLPVSIDDLRFPIKWKMYSIFLWLIEIIQIIVLIPGFFFVPAKKFLEEATVPCVILTEVFFIVMRIQARKKLMNQMIQRLNDILHVADETMKNIVTTTLKPIEDPFKLYFVGGTLACFVWACLPFLLIFKKNVFVYEDYRVPAIFSKQPFSIDVFLVGSVILVLSNTFIFVKKVGVDIYMTHLVLLITVQYQYIATKLATVFRDGNPENEFNNSCQKYQFSNQWVKKEMEALCRHHNSVVRLSSMLKKLLSLNFSMIYVISVFRFCFIGLMLSTVASIAFLEGSLIVTYACGSIIQFYLLCSSVQQLMDASRNMTEKAFHEKWYQFGPSVKHTFMLIILSNNLGCKLASCDRYSLSLSSFMLILNQSYSIALLLLRVK